MNCIQYYDIQKNWRKLRKIYLSPETLLSSWYEMECFQEGKAEDFNFEFKPKPFSLDHRPADYDSCDWRYAEPGCGKRGRKPAYWDFVCYRACHWVNNVGLGVAQIAMPDRPWRLITSNKHTTCWDGDHTLFDINFLALGVTAKEAWELAAEQDDSEHLLPGELLEHY